MHFQERSFITTKCRIIQHAKQARASKASKFNQISIHLVKSNLQSALPDRCCLWYKSFEGTCRSNFLHIFEMDLGFTVLAVQSFASLHIMRCTAWSFHRKSWHLIFRATLEGYAGFQYLKSSILISIDFFKYSTSLIQTCSLCNC